MGKRLCSICILYCLLMLQVPAFGADLVIGTGEGYPPYYYQQDGKLTGICIDMVNAVAAKMGLTVSYRMLPWKRLLRSGKIGEVDAVMPLFKTSDREEYLYFDGLGLLNEANYLFTLPDVSVPYDGDFESINGFRIGVVTGYSYGSRFNAFEFARKVETQNEEHLINMLKHKRFEIGIGNKDVIRFYAHKGGLNDIRFLEPLITKEMLYIGFSRKKGRTDLAVTFSGALKDFKAGPAYHDLLLKYGMSTAE